MAGKADLVLVTGGSGYIAGWCIIELLQRGYQVRTTVRSASKEAKVREAVARVADPGGRLSFAVADLEKDEGWDAAVKGCRYVLHVASPLGIDMPGDLDALVAPARDGALRVLKAAVKAGVRRVVLTSSVAASIKTLQGEDTVNDESVWTNPDDPAINAYRRSKVMAERAAWDFIEAEGGKTQLVTILPSAVLGPVLSREGLGSVQVLSRLLEGRAPGIPRTGFCIVDVRDVAKAHVLAMETPAAAGERFIVSGEFLWFGEMAAMLREALGARADKVPTRKMPDWLVRLLAAFIPALRVVTPTLGRKHIYLSDKAKGVLGLSSRPAKQTIVECAESLLAL